MDKSDLLLVTGAAGFIGSHFVDLALKKGTRVLALDALTYAGNRSNLADAERRDGFEFIHGNICDERLLGKIFASHPITAVINFAAETHVDRSISNPHVFVESNVVGVQCLLDASLSYWRGLANPQKASFRFLQISTDEVFGSIETGSFNESSPYRPNSPYSASKAAADHLVRAWNKTYGLPTLITYSGNQYGPRQFPEKLIPVVIQSCLGGRPVPVYGSGKNVRDWLYVSDGCEGIWRCLEKGKSGESYCLSGHSEKRNLDTIAEIGRILDQIAPRSGRLPHFGAIRHVDDRPGHDWRYSLDDTRARTELDFLPKVSFEEGLRTTISWYLKFFAQES